MNSTSDNVLMMKVKSGDLDKLGLLFERYHRRLFGFFFRLTASRDISEDLVQEVFEKILKYRKTFSEDGTFAAWIFGIARNLHIDYYRKKANDRLENGFTDWDQIPSDGLDNQSGSDSESEINKWLIRKALDHLDEDKKQVLVLSRYEGFKYSEIADVMGCSENTVKVRAFRALKEMKVLMDTIRKKEKL